MSKTTDFGLQEKPQKCRICPMAARGRGFCEDLISINHAAKVLYIFDCPTSDEVLEGKPLAGGWGYFIRKTFIWDIGWKDEEVAVSHVLRCKQENDRFGRPLYPKGWLQKQAEINCRRHDAAVIEWNPDIFICTVHPRDIRSIGCYLPQIQADLTKARKFSKMGYRPAVLFGAHAIELYYPWAKDMGGIKNLRGHFFFGKYPWTDEDISEKSLKKRDLLGA